MAAIVENPNKKELKNKEMEVIGREYEVEVGPGIDANGATISVEEPTVEEPAIEEPAVEEPTDEEPAVEEPAVEEPAVEEPAVEEPAVEEPAVEEPAVEEYEVEVAVNGLTLDLSEKEINTANKQGSIGERKGVSKEQYQQAIRDEICPEIGVYDKSRLAQNLSTIERADENGIFMDAGTLLDIMQKNNIPLPQAKTDGQGMQNIVVRDGSEYTIYFTETAEKLPISSADMSAHRDDILNARNVEELKDKLAEKGNVERGNDKSVENANSIHVMNQSGLEQSGMDIGDR